MEKFNKIKFITFGKGNFIEPAHRLVEHVRSIGVVNSKVIHDFDLPDKFKSEYEHILKYTKGYGYCIWKPFVISDELSKLSSDEILIYMDSTDLPSLSFFDCVIEQLEQRDYLFADRGYGPNCAWTKRDTFILMGCDEPKYWSAGQLEAGVICMRNTEFNRNLLQEWFGYCKNPSILTDEPNTQGFPNLFMNDYNDHRYDQSILTNLQIKYNMITTPMPNELVLFNHNQPQKYS